MQANERIVLDWMAISEGGYVNHPKDPGGATKYGVTERVYHAWLRRKGLPVKGVSHITVQEAETIFVSQYFKPVWFHTLPSGLDYAVVDFAVNSGVSRAVKELQLVLNSLGQKQVKVDGVMGLVTYDAIKVIGNPRLISDKLCYRRLSFMKSLSTWYTFGKGWTRRVMGSVEGAQATDIGVIDRAMFMSSSTIVVSSDPLLKPIAAPGKANETDIMGLFNSIFAAILALFSKTA